MTKLISIAVASLVCSSSVVPPASIEKRADCLLEVDGKVYIKGMCSVMEDTDDFGTGSRVFQLGVDKSGNSGRYWAYILIEKDGVVDGSWNAGDGSHAQARLG